MLMVDFYFFFQKSKFLLVTAFSLIFLKTSANYAQSHYANTSVWLVIRRHITEMCEFVYKREL